MELTDRIIVITGGGSGIGEAIAHAAHAEGARHVVVADLHGEEARRVAADVQGTGVELDVRDEQGIADLVARVEAEHGPIDVFVSNAGIVSRGGLEETNESLQMMWEIHVMAHIYAARAVVPSMIARGEGYLVNVASAAGLLIQLGSLGYTITKNAAVSLADFLAVTHHEQGIRVTVVCPQAVSTNLLRNSPGDIDGDIGGVEESQVAAGDGVLTPEDVARETIDAIREERFLALPHPEVERYMGNRGTDRERWLGGMRKLQRALYPEGERPGDAMAPRED